ncbi:MAG TPA: phage Gp37/Gp68 family protein [Acidobacteriaceae bacterium]|nr:phage Gp37/Gp68 family protein [Acidobacteriaceae bacterium]
MAENSKIEWTDHTFNPWVGCTKISPACDHCYAEVWAKRTGQASLWAGERRRTSEANWQKPIKWDRDAARDGVRRKVFCASLADVFDNQVPDRWREDLWHRIDQTKHLDWLLLTKRPQNIAKMLPDVRTGVPAWGSGWPNVWLGTTVENREEQRRIDWLRSIPAVVRFLSCEPMLAEITPDLSGVHWVICGGESGGAARFMMPGWARGLERHCREAGVAFFMKQMTGKAPIPDDLMIRQFPDVHQ